MEVACSYSMFLITTNHIPEENNFYIKVSQKLSGNFAISFDKIITQ
jgi:hypothetical protein